MEHLKKYWGWYLLIVVAIIVYVNRDKFSLSNVGDGTRAKKGGACRTTLDGMPCCPPKSIKFDVQQNKNICA